MEDIIIDSVTPKEENKIYSKRAIWGFSILFAPLAGGFLVRQNLVDRGQKKAGNKALLVSVICTITTTLIVTNINIRINALTYILNMAGAGILTQFFFNKYIPDEKQYQIKKVWKPLIICIACTLPFVLWIFYFLSGVSSQ